MPVLEYDAEKAGGAATPTGRDGTRLRANADSNSHETRKAARRIRIRAIGPAGRFSVTGQTARALQALVAADKGGVTALEVSTWALRLGAYVFELRKLGLSIETIREKHNELGDWHGRYILQTPVQILEGAL
jgi:Helix-turn-helix domain